MIRNDGKRFIFLGNSREESAYDSTSELIGRIYDKFAKMFDYDFDGSYYESDNFEHGDNWQIVYRK